MLLSYLPVSLPVSFFSRCRFFFVLLSIALLSACGNDSGQSDDSPTSARTIPQNVTLTTGARINGINWSGVGGARGYTVYWSTHPDITPTNGTPIDTRQPTLEHRGLANGTTYYYIITSNTDFGQSAPSAVVAGTPQAAPPAQPDLTLTAGNGRTTLRWDAVPGATHYTLYWKNSAGVSTAMDTTDTRITQVTSPFVHSGLENGQPYFYRLVAENARGTSDASEEHSATPVSPAPSAPVLTQADVNTGQVTLHWQHTGISNQYELYWSTEPLSDNAAENNAPLTHVTSPYTHTPLQDGQIYYYRVRTRNDAGVSALSNLVQITPPNEMNVAEPGAEPTTPTDITISLENGQLSLNWPPVDGALGYNLYWVSDDTSDITSASPRITQIYPPYTHIQLNNGTRYRYRLSALNDHGESALSSEVNGTPQIIIPGVPVGAEALAGDQSILVRWNPVQDATSYTLTLNGDLTNTFTNVSSPYRITDLTNATAYQIQLQAQNAGGLSDFSAAVSATPQEPIPNTPNNLVARPGNASVLLQWAAATPQDINDPNEAITAYRVYTATRPGVRPNNATLINATPTRNDDGRWQLRHTAVQNGQRYYYVVSAENIGGESGLSREVWARPRAPAPGIPANLFAEAGDGQVRIDFTPLDPRPDSSESFTYNLYWTQALNEGRSPTEVISNVQPGYPFTNGANTNGSVYFFQISAVSNGNESPLSDEVSATPQIPAPEQAPQDAQTLTDSGQITLNWTPVAQASGYVIYWATEPDISPQTSNRLSGEMIQPGFVHEGLDNGQSYFYRVAAINAGGEGALSALLAAKPQIPPPTTPTDFTVQPGDNQVTLNFTLTPTATSYRLFWHPDIEAPLAQWSHSTILPGDILTDLSNNQTHYYRLQANNAGGTSPLTAAVSATPQPTLPATPTGLAIVSSDNSLNELNISWHTQPNLDYTLYWSDNPQIAPRDSDNIIINVYPTYRHTGLKSDTTYYYQIIARNSGGESLASEPVQATLGNSTPDIPGTPQNVQGSTGDGQNTLQWQAVTGAEQYTVQWSTQSDMSDPQSATVNNPLFVHQEPPANVLYYQVIAQNSTGDSPPSATIEIVQDILNQAPQITQGATITVTMDEDSSPVAFTLSLDATDNDGDTLTWIIVTLANRGTAQVDSNNTTANLSYSPQANINGSDTFTVQVNDGQGGTDSIQVNVSISPQNDAPVITNTIPNLSVEENTTAVTAITVTDDDSTTFNYTLGGADSALFNMDGDTLNFATAPDFEKPTDSGADNIYNVTVTASDGTNSSETIAFTISVTDADDLAPVITIKGANSVTLIEGDAYTDAGASATDDKDGNVEVITSGSVDTSTIGTYTITYTATDIAGNTSTATRTVIVNAVASLFITTWKTDNPGISEDNQIQIKTSGGGYNYTVDWGDGQTDSNVAGDITHTYSTAGTYTVSITGDFPRIISGTDTDAEKLLSIEQWGSIQWQSMNSAFSLCKNLVGNASDVPDLSQVTDMSNMFRGANAFNQDISAWDVSAVTSMSFMFRDAIAFNQDLSNWNVSSVTNMSRMFNGASAFNQDLSSWDVTSVTIMFFMFNRASAFNQDVSNWNVSAVTTMAGMFSHASAFNQNLSSWDVASVTTMSEMFFDANAFNQNLSNWDVSAVADMSFMFRDAIAFNQDLSSWDVSAVTDMFGMFGNATLSLANYDALLLGWSARSLQSNVIFSGGNSQYSSSSQAARDTLTEAFGWTVTDGGAAQ